ncbi:hypothetical protein Chor_017283 [Crotalus horridus]
MWIQVRTMDGKETHRVDSLSKLTKVEELRQRIHEMEDGHSLFDYSVNLNDIVQLLVRQSPTLLPLGNKEKDSELSDTDSGCCSGQSESDKSSNNGEGAVEMEAQCSSAVGTDLVDPGFGFYKINELVDARDTSMGAWFEAQVVNVTRKGNSASESDEESNLEEAVPDENITYHVKYEETVLKWEDIEIGDVVMLNYNPDDPKERGFWYDAEILQKRETRTYKELYAKIVLGDGGDILTDCRIALVDEIYKIEEPGCAVPLTAESPLKRQSGPVCKHCKDNPNKTCRMCACHICGGKQHPEKQLMCDECDMAFHIYCLSPPLSRIPDDEDWYCPECRNDASEVVLAGEKLKESKKKSKMASANSSSQRDWGKGMACVGRTRECTIVPSNHYGPIPGVPVGTMWKFRVQDHGNSFTYTGSGGRDLSGNKRTAEQSCDQKLTKMNRALALNCSAPINDKEGAEAKDWRAGKPVRVVRNVKGGRYSKYAPTDGNRYDGIYKYPEGYLEAVANKDKENSKKIEEETPGQGKRKRKSGNDSDLCVSPAATPKKTKVEVYKLTPQQKALIKDDEANIKLWNEALEALKEGPDCLDRSFRAKVYSCPACRCDLGTNYTMEVNQPLQDLLNQLFPGYGSGR